MWKDYFVKHTDEGKVSMLGAGISFYFDAYTEYHTICEQKETC